MFFTYKPKGCTADAECANGSRCDTAWASSALMERRRGPDFRLRRRLIALLYRQHDERPGKAMEASGLCVDRSSSVYSDSPTGRVNALSVKMLIGTRDPAMPKKYSSDHTWYSSKFMNPSVRTVREFDPPQAGRTFTPDYRSAREPGARARVFISSTRSRLRWRMRHP